MNKSKILNVIEYPNVLKVALSINVNHGFSSFGRSIRQYACVLVRFPTGHYVWGSLGSASILPVYVVSKCTNFDHLIWTIWRYVIDRCNIQPKS